LKFIFKLKAWQLVLIWVLAFILLRVFLYTDFAIVNFTICVIVYYSWLFATSKALSHNRILPKDITIYWILLLLSTLIFGFGPVSTPEMSNTFSNPVVLILACLFANIALFKINVYTAKAIKMTETNTELKTKDVLWEIISLYLYFYSIWFPHPRVKKIVSKAS